MTTKTPAFFDGIRKNKQRVKSLGSQSARQTQVMARLGRVIFTTAIIKGKPARVRIWKP